MRGGMGSNPFGGYPSMNELDEDIMSALQRGDISIERALALRIIRLSTKDYLYFGLGSNHITPENFLGAYTYLFGNMQSSDPIIQAKCFSTHYAWTSLSDTKPIFVFLRELKEQRKEVVNDNIQQILRYLSLYRAQEWRRTSGHKGKHSFRRVNVVRTLVSPESGKDLAKLYLFGRDKSLPDQQRQIAHKEVVTNALIYKSLLF